ncbi:hypothetical protein ACFVYR_27675 [Streptomyces sp. NPDC058284]|uniref:hypothetical protein n=1 Tax=unclassified Streptomyces TaxID=2593676 RepID=UPI00364B3C9E
METWREDALSGHTHDPNEVTVQIDGVGRQLADLPPDPGREATADGPVFVDETGRRSRRFRRLGVIVGIVCAVYAVVIVGTLLSGNSSAPWLPMPGPEDDKPASRMRLPDRPAVPADPYFPSRVSPSDEARGGPNGMPESGDSDELGPFRTGGDDSRGTPFAPGPRSSSGTSTGTGSDTGPDTGFGPRPADGVDRPGPGPGPAVGTPGPVPPGGTAGPGSGPGPTDPTVPPVEPPPASPAPSVNGGVSGGGSGGDGGGAGAGGEAPVVYTSPAARSVSDTKPSSEGAQR